MEDGAALRVLAALRTRDLPQLLAVDIQIGLEGNVSSHVADQSLTRVTQPLTEDILARTRYWQAYYLRHHNTTAPQMKTVLRLRDVSLDLSLTLADTCH